MSKSSGLVTVESFVRFVQAIIEFFVWLINAPFQALSTRNERWRDWRKRRRQPNRKQEQSIKQERERQRELERESEKTATTHRQRDFVATQPSRESVIESRQAKQAGYEAETGQSESNTEAQPTESQNQQESRVVAKAAANEVEAEDEDEAGMSM